KQNRTGILHRIATWLGAALKYVTESGSDVAGRGIRLYEEMKLARRVPPRARRRPARDRDAENEAVHSVDEVVIGIVAIDHDRIVGLFRVRDRRHHRRVVREVAMK